MELLIDKMPHKMTASTEQIIQKYLWNKNEGATKLLVPFLLNCEENLRTCRKITAALERENFRITTDKKIILAFKIRVVAMEFVDNNHQLPYKPSAYILSRLPFNYTCLSAIFSQVYHTTIEHFIICYKIEKAKFLLQHASMAVKAVAEQLHYERLTYFSAQFKKITGESPSAFKRNSRSDDGNDDNSLLGDSCLRKP